MSPLPPIPRCHSPLNSLLMKVPYPRTSLLRTTGPIYTGKANARTISKSGAKINKCEDNSIVRFLQDLLLMKKCGADVPPSKDVCDDSIYVITY